MLEKNIAFCFLRRFIVDWGARGGLLPHLTGVFFSGIEKDLMYLFIVLDLHWEGY